MGHVVQRYGVYVYIIFGLSIFYVNRRVSQNYGCGRNTRLHVAFCDFIVSFSLFGTTSVKHDFR